MKQLTKILVLAIVLISIGFIGCKKQDVVDIGRNENKQNYIYFNDFNVVKKNKMLSFPTVEDYRKVLSYLATDEQNNFKKWGKKVKFKNSMSEAIKNKKIKDKEDTLLSQIINNTGNIEIQGKIFSLDFNKRIVKVYNSISDFNDSKFYKIFSFDDEVLTILFGDKKTKKEYEKTKNKGLPNYNPDYRIFYNIGVVNVLYKIAYHKYGIYFTLVAKIKKSRKEFGGTDINVSAYGWYVPRNKGEVYFNTSDYSEGGVWPKYHVRPWHSMRSLSSYDINGGFSAYYVVSQSDSWEHKAE